MYRVMKPIIVHLFAIALIPSAFGEEPMLVARGEASKVEFTCSRRTLWLEGEDIKLGSSRECEQSVVYSLSENHREKFMVSVNAGQAQNSQAIDDTFGLSEETVTAVVKARVLPWLRTTLVHYQARPPGGDKPYRFTAGYGTISGLEGLPLDLTIGREVDDSSDLEIGYVKKNLGSASDPVSVSLYGGASRYQQEFRSGAERTDHKWMSAVQVNLNGIDQSMIVGVGKDTNGPTSHMVGFHGSMMGDKRNEWTTLCRVRRSLDARSTVRKTEFCIVHIGFGNERMAGRGRYMDLLGTFAPGLIKPTRIVNGTTLSDNPNSASVGSRTDRPKWEFAATKTDVEIIDGVTLNIESVELYRSFHGQFRQINDPYVGVSYMGTNNLYFNNSRGALEDTKPRREMSLVFGGGFGKRPGEWDAEVRIGWDMRRREPVIGLAVSRLFND